MAKGCSIYGAIVIDGRTYCEGAAWDDETPAAEVYDRLFKAGQEWRRFHHSPRFLFARLRMWWLMRSAWPRRRPWLIEGREG